MANKKKKSPYWDIAPLLSHVDINGRKPKMYMVSSNRQAGKTTTAYQYGFNRFIRHGEKPAIMVRFGKQLNATPDIIWRKIGFLNPDFDIDGKIVTKDVDFELFIKDKRAGDKAPHVPFGYGIAINAADALKNEAPTDVSRMFFDEFQSETGHYCHDEVNKLQSVHSSLARGGGAQARYLPIIMMSNPVSMLNPYYDSMNIGARLNDKVHFLHGNGWVLEHYYNESAAAAVDEFGLGECFPDSKYSEYAKEAVYLNDNNCMIEKKKGQSKYIATLRYDGNLYAIREFPDCYYVDEGVDPNFPFKIAVSVNDIAPTFDYNPRIFIEVIKKNFENGHFKFKNLKCKVALFKLMAIKV